MTIRAEQQAINLFGMTQGCLQGFSTNIPDPYFILFILFALCGTRQKRAIGTQREFDTHYSVCELPFFDFCDRIRMLQQLTRTNIPNQNELIIGIRR
jgi:hypothetical protein